MGSRNVVLISCVKTKRSFPCAAKDLYNSSLFRAQRAFAESIADAWYILSAKYGVVHPNEEIAPYEKTLKNAPAAAKRAWTHDVFVQISGLTTTDDKIIITAGEDYCRYLEPVLRNRGHTVWRPVKGLRMGYQPGRLHELASLGRKSLPF